MSVGSGDPVCHCKCDKHLGRASAWFHRALHCRIHTVPHPSSCAEHCGPASLLTYENLSPQAGGTALWCDQGEVPVWVSLGLHWAIKWLLCWMTLHVAPSPDPYFLADLLEPHESCSNLSKKGFSFSHAGWEEDGRRKDHCQGQERKSEIGAGRSSGRIGNMRWWEVC